ncbi:hypothetical protein DEQ92_20290 [Haloferax sp. Atlit-6N]|uniref:DUF3307 domain-containing protein n=1 Tax=Haloferax sp. Atlit-6N TaxID=2077205 RepID=UPI000E22A27F|nr:DUF3307 domain-containing protein [Haloferax sp. Atlit-6N]REA00195.1 hypothetical protein DEQ92_20290 [Haloferax sp. Atlit-6N]
MSDVTLYALAAHAAGDFLLQTDRQAAEKFDDPAVRTEHVAVYTSCFAPVAMAADWNQRGTLAFVVTLFGTHFVIDSQRWADDSEAFPTFSVWRDQALHVVALAVAVALAEVVNDD